jgi:hypothetical protein
MINEPSPTPRPAGPAKLTPTSFISQWAGPHRRLHTKPDAAPDMRHAKLTRQRDNIRRLAVDIGLWPKALDSRTTKQACPEIPHWIPR